MRILLVEDNRLLANSLAKVLSAAQFSVDVMHDGQDADHVLLTQDYALVILDLSLPRMDGLEVLRRLRSRGNKVSVLILTARNNVGDRVLGLDLGADDYLTKPFELTELEARIRALIRRASGHADNRITCGDLVYQAQKQQFELAGETLLLTPREHALLEVLLLNSGRTLGKEALCEKIVAMNEEVNPEAIEIYVHRLRKKLQGSNVQIVTLRGLGYSLEVQNAK
ncbi:response regulator [Chitinimonas sp. BJB300]|uniref:response regulator n=1 Tax=Chitinimonas sp. BJB300 TaxID=1559339 RepID=UPI000C0E427B|nr:response regulator [Chitinimonas sp. BJB300]PHV11057.1 DNA-binding response regulator [Chitinimonas sp. BJB300]TSJ90085.1 response regulator [Chitinimonas sp. BJB300]